MIRQRNFELFDAMVTKALTASGRTCALVFVTNGTICASLVTEAHSMPMTNAERQRRYMQRLKERAADQAVPTRAQLDELRRKLRSAEAKVEKLELQADRHRAELKGARERGDQVV